MVLLGLAGVLRLIPELIGGGGPSWIYGVIVGWDLFFGIAMVVAGQGLRRGIRWAPSLALQAAGAVLSTSLCWGFLLASTLLARSIRGELAWLPRLWFYLIAVGFWPYAIFVLMRATPRDFRIYHWVAFATWAATGAFFVWGLRLLG
jgi:hypothetical protein